MTTIQGERIKQLSDENEALRGQLNAARAGLRAARAFIAQPTRWRTHIAVRLKHVLDAALEASEPPRRALDVGLVPHETRVERMG